MDDTSNAPVMDQELAQRLFKEGATLVMLGVPEGTEVGIDYNSWRVGSKFHGVKMIPPGIHFVYYCAAGSDGQVAPRTGFFYNFRQREVIVKKWDKKHEDLVCATPEEQERLEQNKQELDRYLGVYPYKRVCILLGGKLSHASRTLLQAYWLVLRGHVTACHVIVVKTVTRPRRTGHYKKWISLTNHITSELVERLEPASGRICSVMQVQSERTNTESRKAAAESQPHCDVDKDGLPAIQPVPGSEICFSQFCTREYPEGATPQEITKYNMDATFCLTHLLDTTFKGGDMTVLGEIQFAFVAFLVGQVYEGFEQWKRLVALLCSCDDALAKHPDLYDQFITVLHYHLAEVPEDFFVDIVSKDNFLTTNLQVLFANLHDSEAPSSLKNKARRFQRHLTKKFTWDFASEPDDCAPVLVEPATV